MSAGCLQSRQTLFNVNEERNNSQTLTPIAVTPMPKLKALVLAKPASSKKYVLKPRTNTTPFRYSASLCWHPFSRNIPAPCWSTKTIVATTVRLKLTPVLPQSECNQKKLVEWNKPLKQSMYLALAAYESSSSIVSWICWSCIPASIVGPPSRVMTFRASSILPSRTSHQGDSGAKGRPTRRATGKIHWSALNGGIKLNIGQGVESLTKASGKHKHQFGCLFHELLRSTCYASCWAMYQ